jgi:hypothetical protein
VDREGAGRGSAAAPWIGRGNEGARRQVTSCDGSGVNEVADSRWQTLVNEVADSRWHTREGQTHTVGVKSLTVKILVFILFSSREEGRKREQNVEAQPVRLAGG